MLVSQVICLHLVRLMFCYIYNGSDKRILFSMANSDELPVFYNRSYIGKGVLTEWMY